MKSRKNISRVDGSRALGWQVRFEREGFVRYRLFSDSKYGGNRKALAAARAYRDRIDALAPRSKSGQSLPPGSGTIKRGVVSYLDAKGVRYTYRAVLAWIRVAPNRHAETRWSIDKWGIKAARKGAEDWLRTKQKEQKLNYARTAHDIRAKASGHPQNGR